MSYADLPRSWAEVYDRLGHALGGEPTATEWIRQVIEARFGPHPDRLQRSLAFQKAIGATFVLQDEGPMLAFDVEVRRITQEAFARFFDGVIVSGPPWRLSPYEDLPLYSDWLKAATDLL